MPAAKGRTVGLVLAALAALAAAALPAGASIPRPGDQLLEPDHEALLAALEASPDAPQAEATLLGTRFELLAPVAVDRLLFTGRPPRLHLFAELETRVRASDLLSFPQPLEIEELTLRIAPGDRETGLYYAKARYYDPELGLFLTQDPFEGVLDTPPSLHRYLYAFGNPTRFVDPTGRQTEETAEERIAFLRQFGGVLREGEEPPPGTVLTTDSLGVRIVTPVAQLEDNATGQESEEEPGLFDRIVDFFVGDTLEEGEKLVEETSELEQILTDGTHRSRRQDVQELAERRAIRTLGDSNGGLPFFGASVRQGEEVTKQAGRTALEAEESAEKVSAAVGIGGLFARLGRRVFARFLRQEAGEVGEQVARVSGRSAATGAEVRQGVRGTGAGARRFVEGELFETAIRSDAGTVRVLAETSVSGGTLTLSDLVIYADDGTLVNQVGAQQFLALRDQVAREAAGAGFDTLRITGVRVPTSSSANPGKTIDRVIDLSRFK